MGPAAFDRRDLPYVQAGGVVDRILRAGRGVWEHSDIERGAERVEQEQYESALQSRLPETRSLLQRGRLLLHPAVSRVVLHGSRGLRGGFRPDSDIDLTLIVAPVPKEREALAGLLQDVIDASLRAWRGPIELDLAAAYDVRGCGLRCFDVERCPAGESCAIGGSDCFGLYKSQKGFRGFVEGCGVQVRLMQPCLKIWERRTPTAHSRQS